MSTTRVRIDPKDSATLPKGRIDFTVVDSTTETEIALQQEEDDAEAMQDMARYARRIRRRLGLSQVELARRIDVPHETIRNWEQGSAARPAPRAHYCGFSTRPRDRAPRSDLSGGSLRGAAAWQIQLKWRTLVSHGTARQAIEKCSQRRYAVRVFLTLCILLLPVSSYTADYTIDRHEDGPFAAEMAGGFGVRINKGSTLTRESILFNDPTCPIQIRRHTTKIAYKNRGYRFVADTVVEVTNPIVAYKMRVMLYDAFGAHMTNLGSTEVRDFNPGQTQLHAEWRASDRDISELLTTVTFVSRVRLADGSQWAFDAKNLAAALATLKLEEIIVDDKKRSGS